MQQERLRTKYSTVLPCDQEPAVNLRQGQGLTEAGRVNLQVLVSNAVHIVARASLPPVVPPPLIFISVHKRYLEPISTLQKSFPGQNLFGMPRTSCDSLPQSHSCPGSPSNHIFSGIELLLPAILVSLSHITEGTAYKDTIAYLVPPEVVETSIAHALQDWKTMAVNTLIKRIVSLKDSAMLMGIIHENPTTE